MSDQRSRAWSQEMREVHQRLRAALELSRETLEDVAHPEGADRDLLLYCWGFCAALTGHHRSEDSVLFPMITVDAPDLAPVIVQLTQDHNMISYLINEWQRAIQTGAAPAEQLRHLDGIEAVMETHFRYEELRLLSVLDGLDCDGMSKNDLFGAIA